MKWEIVLGVIAALGLLSIAYAASVTWTSDFDFSGGYFEDTKNESGNLMLNDTLGTYDSSGYYVSAIINSYDPVESVVASWSATEPDENVNVTIEVSVDGGNNYCDASNGDEINGTACQGSGFETEQEIVFRANFSTNDTTQTAMLHDITIEYEMIQPFMEVELSKPYDNTIVGQNKTVAVNASVVCRVFDCGLVNATLRYNESSLAPDTEVPTDYEGLPFYIISGENTANCSDKYLTAGEMCNVSWVMNVTGDISTAYDIDVIFESNRSTVVANDTDDSTLEIGKVLIINVDFTEIDFGLLDPGDGNQPAGLNEYGYNISVDVNSNDVENLWIMGTNLTIDDDTGLDCEVQEQYNRYEGNTTNYPCQINVSRISWSLEKEPLEDEIFELSGNYERINKDMQVFSPGTSIATYYWIDVPYGIYAGSYTGTIMFLANATW